MGGVHLPGDLHLLTHPLVLGVSGLMLFVEFFADKLPWGWIRCGTRCTPSSASPPGRRSPRR